jgi:hypothetical protein
MNKLAIRSETYEGVTEVPHFPVVIDYEGCHVQMEDIYIDDLKAIADSLGRLEGSRTGEVRLDGGSRFTVVLSIDSHGGLLVRFQAEPVPFPGRLLLEGYFRIDGEYTGQYILGFQKLLKEGAPISIEQPPPPDWR